MRLWSLFFILISTTVAQAAGNVSATRTAARAKSNSLAPQVGLAYSAVTDMNDRGEGHVITHSAGLDLGWELPRNWSASLVFGGTYASIDNEIIKDDRSHLTDVYSGLTYRHKLAARHALDLQGGVFWPTGEDSQFEGQKGRFLGLLRLRSRLSSWFAVSNKLSGQYINNEFDYSPTTDELNRRGIADYSLEGLITIKAFFLSSGFGVRNSTYIDGMSEMSYFNVSKVGVRAGRFSAYIAYMNGSYRDDQKLQPLFFDRYKKLMELALIYAF